MVETQLFEANFDVIDFISRISRFIVDQFMGKKIIIMYLCGTYLVMLCKVSKRVEKITKHNIEH